MDFATKIEINQLSTSCFENFLVSNDLYYIVDYPDEAISQYLPNLYVLNSTTIQRTALSGLSTQ